MTDEQIGHVRDDDLGDVLTLGPMHKTDDAVDYLYRTFGIPDVTASTLTKARKRGEIVASVFGQSVVFAERDLNAWVASRYGKASERYASRAEAMLGNQHAVKGNRGARAAGEAQ
ncbi:MerR family transcriptional regulator [Mycolicibacterium brisbanense]|uniref:Helix-turn-helix domain-containing protein n=1 Tax=Mycolicibacterium brisbanense TaxID=146020 RepID=A0A100W0I9_9MYCO|nr:DNA-binding protein [Mycolicibacterium brisbanense]MCV7161865.1 DNA-binding protein [Mycolicibacterium brisbanense]GAS89378.1 uncharacterized protein RMCB_3474 [Mycolicibacterium brisbanense]